MECNRTAQEVKDALAKLTLASDGHHSFIRWNLVIYRSIGGFSRRIMNKFDHRMFSAASEAALEKGLKN